MVVSLTAGTARPATVAPSHAPSTGDRPTTGLLILDSAGRILHDNDVWRRFVADYGLAGAEYRVGGDYLAACRAGWRRNLPEIKRHGEIVADILNGGAQQPALIHLYPFGSQGRWYRSDAVPLRYSPVDGVLIFHEDVTERMLAEQRLTHQAFFDALTELPNRALFLDRLQHAIAYSSRTGDPLAAMFIDLDNFKTINDTLGHLTGDKLLAEVAERLSDCLRECDTVGRLGGDEFGMILPGIGVRDAAVSVAEKILAALAAPFRSVGGREFQVTASIGVAFYPDDGGTLDALMHSADQAMYCAKAEGRKTFPCSKFKFFRSVVHGNPRPAPFVTPERSAASCGFPPLLPREGESMNGVSPSLHR